MAGRRAPRVCGQQFEPRAESSAHALHPERFDPSRGEFDRQGHAVQAAADFDDRLDIVGAKLEARVRLLDAGGKERDRAVVERPRRLRIIRHGERAEFGRGVRCGP